MLGAAITLLVALISSLWRFLAAQSPSSPLHLGPLLGPIESLSYACWVAGFGGLAVAAIMRSSDFDRRAAKKISTALVVGWVLLLSGLILGAVLGTYGTQVIKALPAHRCRAHLQVAGLRIDRIRAGPFANHRRWKISRHRQGLIYFLHQNQNDT